MQLEFFSNQTTEEITAESPIMKKLLNDLEKIAKSDANIFISGESGTGKEVMAKRIHHLSKKAKQPFICVNCAALPDTLIESEFFGHEKGAFTGALTRRIGRFELADKGTLLLDEISEIPLHLQAKLLRAVQEQEFERLGGISPIHVNVRFISTSNRNMIEAIEKKHFREDLYYRLNVIPLHLPPLRERKEDILPLAKYLLQKFCLKNGVPLKLLTSKAEEKLYSYYWPGNIRQLSNLIYQLTVMVNGVTIEENAISFDQISFDTPSFPQLPLSEVEKIHILETLKSFRYNRTKAAKALGVTTRTLRNKLKIYGNIPHSL